ncbi:MAG: phosphoribosylanthranilate isomerase [Dehalococcoidia bacterium]
MVRVQIAGISNLEDALAVERAGADAIGFTLGLPTGPHNGLDEHGARAIIRALPPLIVPLLITYLVTAAEVVPLCRYLGVSTVQLHAPADPAEIAAMRAGLPGLKVILAVHVTGEEAVAEAVRVAPHADALILDTYDPATGRHGATGRTHDWAISRRIVEASPAPVILAGGLTPENVGAAVRQVRPWAVDVHTGVERPDGATDHARVAAFVRAAREAPR